MDGITNFGKKPKSYNIRTKNKHFKKPPTYLEIGWQTYRVAAFIFFILSMAVMKYLVEHIEKKVNDGEIMSVLKIVSFFFILNFGIFLFITVYYKYRKSIKGVNGPRGSIGGRGHQGKTQNCNICKIKTGGMKRELDIPPIKENIDTRQNLVYDPNKSQPGWRGLFETNDNSKPIHYHNNFIDDRDNISAQIKKIFFMTPAYLGVGHKSDDYKTFDDKGIVLNVTSTSQSPTELWLTNNNNNIKSKKPIIGASATFNKKTGELYSIMYFIDKNKLHNPNKYVYTPATVKEDVSKSDKKILIIGENKSRGVNASFRAPKNSAVYKIEVVDNGYMIKSVRFYCADILTGKTVKVIDPLSGKKRKYATLGINVNIDDKTMNIQSVSAKSFFYKTANKTYYLQPFLSQVGGIWNDERILSLGFTGASVYVPS